MSDGIIVAMNKDNFSSSTPPPSRCSVVQQTTEAKEWSQHYGLFLPDQVHPLPSDDLPLIRAVRGEEIKDAEFFVRHAQAPDGLWMLASARPFER
jgi:hypothetical protein